MKFIGCGESKKFVEEKVTDAFNKGWNLVLIWEVEPNGRPPAYNIYATKGKIWSGRLIED